MCRVFVCSPPAAAPYYTYVDVDATDILLSLFLHRARTARQTWVIGCTANEQSCNITTQLLVGLTQGQKYTWYLVPGNC